jgi:hypothetical protein
LAWNKLSSLKSIFNNFKYIEGFSTTTADGSPAVEMDTDRTKQTASDRVYKTLHTLYPDPTILQNEVTGGLGCNGPMVQNQKNDP